MASRLRLKDQAAGSIGANRMRLLSSTCAVKELERCGARLHLPSGARPLQLAPDVTAVAADGWRVGAYTGDKRAAKAQVAQAAFLDWALLDRLADVRCR